jgi:hypothetical protein
VNANHATDEADKRSRQFRSLLSAEEFEFGVPCGNQQRFRESRRAGFEA